MPRTNDPQLTYEICTSVGPHEYVTEASTAGFPVGVWPSGVATTMGNKLPFMRGKPRYAEGSDGERELMYWTYAQANGCLTVKVFND